MGQSRLRTFVEVMRRGSFAAVARDRGVDPSSVSRAVAALEDELGLRLFQRTTRRLSPTEAGIVYFERVEPIVEELEQARLMASDLGARAAGTLRLSAPVSFAQLNLVPLLPAFAAAHPGLSFELLLSDAAIDLLSERIDVAIRLGPLAETTHVGYRLCPMVSKICASPAYLERHGWPRTPADLARHECLLLAMPGFGARWRFRDGRGRISEVAARGRLRTSNAIALKQCALAAMGLTLQARWIVGRELRDGSLVDVFPQYEVTAADFDSFAWLLYPSRRYVPLKVRFFVDFLKTRFGHAPPWDTAAG